jgi:prolyl oligopeptidase
MSRPTLRRSARPVAAILTGLIGAVFTLCVGGPSVAGDTKDSNPHRLDYPKARKAGVTDDYHGTRVDDPYRWLEDPDSPETRKWVEAENAVTFAYLDAIPARKALRERLSRVWDYEKFGVPNRERGRYFYSHNSGLQNQAVIFTTPSLDAEAKVLLDPNTLSAAGTVALSGLEPSPDGSRIAYGLASAGSDWQEWKVRDVDNGRDLSDHINWVKFSGVSWTHDGRGFYYGRYPEPKPGESLKGANYYQKLYLHKLGTPQADDRLIYERPDRKEWQFHGAVTDDGRYLVITVSKGTDDKYRILYQELSAEGSKPVELIDNFDHEYTFIDNDGPIFWFKTDLDAPRGRVVAIDTRNPERRVEVIPEAIETLVDADVVGDLFFARYLKDARTHVKVFGLNGKFVREVEFPGLGTATGFSGKRTDKETFYSFTTFTAPASVYRYDVATGHSTLFRKPALAFDPADFETTQVFYTSKDGTKVPMFLSHKKGLKRDGSNPTHLYGYGGYNIPLTPSFRPEDVVWMERGGVYAVANLRGGGEYGEPWHKAGTKDRKQNVFDDFIAAAEWLIREKYTSTPRLAISGRSNGGLLVGACLTQRPELFGATLPGVGVLDMLRFHKFTIGWAWVDDYGSADDPGQFQALYAYSPLHNIKPGTKYPPTLITTADHDDRVVPAHSFKFAAALQAAQAGDAPILIRIETAAGHGAGKPTAKLIDEAADRWAFLVRALNLEPAGAR